MNMIDKVWKCSRCGSENQGEFCSCCGKPRETERDSEDQKEEQDHAEAETALKEQQAEIPAEQGCDEQKNEEQAAAPALDQKGKKKIKLQGKRKKIILLVIAVCAAAVIAMALLRPKAVKSTALNYQAVKAFSKDIALLVPEGMELSSSDGHDIYKGEDRINIQLMQSDNLPIVSDASAEDGLNTFTDSFIANGNCNNVKRKDITADSIRSKQLNFNISADDTDYRSTAVFVPLYKSIFVCMFSWPADGEKDYSKVADYVMSTIRIPTTKTISFGATEEAKKVVSIAAKYTGAAKIGTVLDSKNTDIHVTGRQQNGEDRTLYKWTVSEPAVLAGSSSAAVTIQYKDPYSSKDLTCTLTVVCSEEDPVIEAQRKAEEKENYKNSCADISYEELARNGNAHKGENIRFTGKVIQVIEGSGGSATMRIEVTQGNYGIWDDVVMVSYQYAAGESRFLEKDIVNFYGTCSGLYSYTSVMGSSITVPSCIAKYVDLQ
ncbi:MAG: hypothetical protein LKF53_07455 [Solobacterium sp.]|jgi:hypothetical protein|nr:hypothetical protein [Solobacterium sp.]MCH4206211.1 hypothetical protein [Solobacterium sp.]MCH4227677.1 hypothetical protein [Solobacterium sp.]MCH4283104.1 hypothetical protein [Solobacterium sp.]